MQGSLIEDQTSRPEQPHVHSHHFWRRLGDIFAVLARMDKRGADAEDLNLIVDEYGSVAGTSLMVMAQTTNPVIIESIIIQSIGGTAVLQIADRAPIAIAAGLTVISSISLLRKEQANSTLIGSGTTFLSLEIMGVEKPRMTV